MLGETAKRGFDGIASGGLGKTLYTAVCGVQGFRSPARPSVRRVLGLGLPSADQCPVHNLCVRLRPSLDRHSGPVLYLLSAAQSRSSADRFI